MSRGAVEAQNFLRMFRSLTAFAEAVVELGDVEKALAQAVGAEAAASASAKAIAANAAEQQALLDALKKEVADAKADRIKIMQAMQSESDAILAKATYDAGMLIEAARTEAAAVAASEAQKLNETRQEIGRLAVNRDAAQKELEAVQRKIDELKRWAQNG
jgi:hypothetical protein